MGPAVKSPRAHAEKLAQIAVVAMRDGLLLGPHTDTERSEEILADIFEHVIIAAKEGAARACFEIAEEAGLTGDIETANKIADKIRARYS